MVAFKARYAWRTMSALNGMCIWALNLQELRTLLDWLSRRVNLCRG